CYHLAKSGASVLGLEQFSLAHSFGSQAGQSRLIRKAYFEHSDYVPLLERAYENWQEIEEKSGTSLYFPTGIVYMGPHDHSMMQGIRYSADKYAIPLEQVDAARVPGFQMPTGFDVLLEPDAGFVTPERAVLAFSEEAIRLGAVIHSNCRVEHMEKNGGVYLIQTPHGQFKAAKLVVTAGAWTRQLLPDLGTPLIVTEQWLAWMRPTDWEKYSLENFTCWGYMEPETDALLYGFPVLPAGEFGGPIGMKVALHKRGQSILPSEKSQAGYHVDNANLLKRLIDRVMPGAVSDILSMKSCLYNYSSDEHFIVDHHPADADMLVATGFSGHGFKFAPVIGEVIADLTLKGATDLPVDFLKLDRFHKAGSVR
ncbi:MAG: N-methyl-L-tryptophan oxidase, partial [Cyclobacteriaceae bacterium]|nr:N-methyl-L-tryptophan oxidase [Cyclobacteriaceae bacterium]